MMQEPGRVHFIGIGGMGMRGLAEMLLRQGWTVSGSDLEHSDYLKRLEKLGATIHIGQHADHVTAETELVVYSAAIGPNNPERLAARARGCQVKKYAEVLGWLMSVRRGVAVSGTHGKTTTTAMIAWVLDRAGKDPSFVVGADVPQLGSGSRAGGEILVVEACEYDRSFHNFRPEVALINNIEEDHLDYYTGGLDEIVESFAYFARLPPRSGLVVACAEDPRALQAAAAARCALHTFALDSLEPWTWTGHTSDIDAGCYALTIRWYGEFFAHLRLAIPGRHNALNALAASAVLAHFDVEGPVLERALGEFRGAERRMQLLGEAGGVTVVDDYAHHPTEIRCTLRAIRDFYRPRRLWCIFQPHQHSRTRFLLDDFARSFDDTSYVLVPDIYFVRDSQEERAAIDSGVLVARIRDRGGDAEYLPGFDLIAERLIQEVRPGDVVATLGAGPVWQVAYDVLRRLRLRRAG